MQIKIELDENDLKRLVANEIHDKMPEANIKESDIKITVKSKQNFRSEWEEAEFRATVNKVN